jgi:HSP20 family protein
MHVQWNPWRDLAHLEHAMNTLFDARTATRDTAGRDTAAPTWQPPVDVFEDADRILLVVDLPGIEEKELSLSIEKNVLTLRAERKAPAGVQAAGFRNERPFGVFARAFTLPGTVDGENVGAELKQGVLTLTLPKKREAQPRQIKVQLG